MIDVLSLKVVLEALVGSLSEGEAVWVSMDEKGLKLEPEYYAYAPAYVDTQYGEERYVSYKSPVYEVGYLVDDEYACYSLAEAVSETYGGSAKLKSKEEVEKYVAVVAAAVADVEKKVSAGS